MFVAELPTFIESSEVDSHHSHSEEDNDEQDKQLSERLSHHLVNYNKFRIAGTITNEDTLK